MNHANMKFDHFRLLMFMLLCIKSLKIGIRDTPENETEFFTLFRIVGWWYPNNSSHADRVKRQQEN